MSRVFIPLLLVVGLQASGFAQKPGKPAKPSRPSAPSVQITLGTLVPPVDPPAPPAGRKLGHLAKDDPSHPGAAGRTVRLSPVGVREREICEQEYQQRILHLQIEKEQEIMLLPPLSPEDWSKVRHGIDLKYQALMANAAATREARLREIDVHYIIVEPAPTQIIIQPVAPPPPVVLPFPNIDIRIRN